MMKLTCCFLALCLYQALELTWGQAYNPSPLSQRNRQTPRVVMPRFGPRVVQEAFDRAAQIISARRNAFQGRTRSTTPTNPNSPEARMQTFRAAGLRTRTLENVQERFEEATRVLLTEFNLSPEQIMFGLSETDLKSLISGNDVASCEAQFNFTNCRATDRFRTLDGTCNNLHHSSWGMASSCYERLVDPDYADGAADKRRAMSGNELPTPRRVSLEIHNHLDNPTDYVNHMFMTFGQIISHDINLTPLSRGPDNEIMECCPLNEADPPNCDPIVIAADDPFFSTFNINCLSNVRSAMCSTCTLGPRQQTNQVTAFTDLSLVYGLNRDESQNLRNNDGTGTLRFVNVAEGGELPPGSFTPTEDQCSFQNANLDCFQTGDARANQHPALTTLHIIFLREHNRLARLLRTINPGWDDERLFQEARRIAIAEYQMIIYNEFLPLAIGPERMQWFDLNIRPANQFTQYDETVQATLVNEFSVAAYRFGHSTVNSFFQINRAPNNGSYLRDIFNFPFNLYTGQVEGFLEGMTQSAAQKFDRHMVRDLTNHLYQNSGTNNGSGLDLASLNINRGRDHGVPGYTALMEFCGGPTVTTWRQLDRLFQRGVRPLFERLYERVEDIDLFTGGMGERPNQGAIVGPTFTCILGIQFYHLKYGDRFYFEHGRQPGSFTPAQLQEIKKVTLGKLLCDNTRMTAAPLSSLLYQGPRNPLQQCEDKPSINLNLWRE